MVASNLHQSEQFASTWTLAWFFARYGRFEDIVSVMPPCFLASIRIPMLSHRRDGESRNKAQLYFRMADSQDQGRHDATLQTHGRPVLLQDAFGECSFIMFDQPSFISRRRVSVR